MAIDPIRAALAAAVLLAARRQADHAELRGAIERAAQALTTLTPKEER